MRHFTLLLVLLCLPAVQERDGEPATQPAAGMATTAPATQPTATAPATAPATQPMTAETFAGLKLRGIGPALMAGRIGDIAVNPRDPRQWYIAVASGGVWKSDNAGTT